MSIITKAALIERETELLVALTQRTSVHVLVSVPVFNEAHARAMEPFVATPTRRLRIIEKLAAAGVTVDIMVAPLIPGLNDSDVGPLACRRREGRSACSSLLRLPGSSADVFATRLRATLPLRAERVLTRTREMRGGDP